MCIKGWDILGHQGGCPKAESMQQNMKVRANCTRRREKGQHVHRIDLSTRLWVALEMTSQPLSPSAFLPQGAVPFLVSATSGTTVLGAFDPLEAVADVCQRHGLWLHVDVSGTQA